MTPAVPVYHVITPGDHFSPRTGSAIPSVVHGLASSAAERRRTSRFPQFVVVQRGTYVPRYESATVVEYTGGPPPNPRERAADAVMGRLGLPRVFTRRAYRPVAEALDRVTAGIVVAHNGPQLARLMTADHHRKVLYAHNDLFQSMSTGEATRVVAACDRVVCVSDHLRNVLESKVSRSLRDRFRVVKNGVDTTQFSPSQDDSLAPLRVMFVGRMIREKGADVLLRAGALLRRHDVEFMIVGSQGFDRGAPLTDYERSLRDLAREVPNVTFEPFVDRRALPALLRTASVLVAPGRWPEPWALTVGEGLATGLAVVATRVGGTAEQLGESGLLVEPDDPSALAGAIGNLLDDADLRARLGSAGRLKALAQDWGWAWQNLERVLGELAARPARHDQENLG